MNIFQSIAPAFPYIVAILPFVAFGASYAWQRSTYTPQQNGMISALTILVAAILSALLSGKLTGNALTDTAYVLTLATTLQVETFRPLQGYLRGDAPAQSNQPPPPASPQPIILPTRPGGGNGV